MDWQTNFLKTLQQIHHPVLDAFFNFASWAGEETVYILIAAWLLWCYNKRLSYRVGLIFLTGTAFNGVLKNLFAMSRPIGVDGIESQRLDTATGHSFPSGHTQGAASFWLALMLQVRRPGVWALGLFMILSVGLSRLYLGVHWPVDVIAGIGFALIWVLAANAFIGWCERRKQLGWLWLLVTPFLIAVFIYPDYKDLVIVAGAAVGFLAGMQVEQRWLNVSVTGTWPQKIGRFVLGLVILMAIRILVKAVMPLPLPWGDLIRYGLIGFWLTAGAPWVFTKIGLMTRQG
ncbi:phosphatase PAP2 family protein [Reinekea blandensis]|uniref:undecaprenyl-diphosphate phosphatase n=1 Tax=Reinekea blandensis MED297 TaxID=314283 RepID=A4BCP1_9GAMM|nr:phosphatase PAP2 family protein [Reinekea blandensis]EAR09973.1 Membrane-associated phospholipid phosphatase [Reinekea sp. MED297] [Reinekea blandensis MED297]